MLIYNGIYIRYFCLVFNATKFFFQSDGDMRNGGELLFSLIWSSSSSS